VLEVVAAISSCVDAESDGATWEQFGVPRCFDGFDPNPSAMMRSDFLASNSMVTRNKIVSDALYRDYKEKKFLCN
jgi:hypothetical protein